MREGLQSLNHLLSLSLNFNEFAKFSSPIHEKLFDRYEELKDTGLNYLKQGFQNLTALQRLSLSFYGFVNLAPNKKVIV